MLCVLLYSHDITPVQKSWWDGKLGIWPIGDWKTVKQKSKNKPKGTLVWKNKMVTKH